jgi:hypothetical protein
MHPNTYEAGWFLAGGCAQNPAGGPVRAAPLELLCTEEGSKMLDDLVWHLFLNVVATLYGFVRDDV